MSKNKYEKSAKDKAFDKERGKLNKRIRELEYELKKKELEIRDLKEVYEKKLSRLEELEDWNIRLLEYMDLSEKELKTMINKEKTANELLSAFSKLTNVSRHYIV